MNIDQSSNYSYLDSIRINEGTDKCKAVFHEISTENKKKAVNLLNDKRTTFPCLYIMLPEIEALNLQYYLNRYNITALKIINQILKPQDSYNIDYLSTKKDTVYWTLKWILETGYVEDSLDNEYEEILDIVVSLLINTYQDKSILPMVVDMIFNRNKKERYIHDLVWAFFQIREPYALALMAERIRSADQESAELCCNLLNIEKSIYDNNNTQYESYLKWLKENDPFLYFTGESFQLTSEPVICRVDLERKYLHKGVDSYNRKPIILSDEMERERLEAFKALPYNEKLILSAYSYKIHKRNIQEWEEWLKSSIDEQIKSAKNN